MTTLIEIEITGCADEDRIDTLADDIDVAVAGIADFIGYDQREGDGLRTVLLVTGPDEPAIHQVVQPIVETFARGTGATYSIRRVIRPDDDEAPPATSIF